MAALLIIVFIGMCFINGNKAQDYPFDPMKDSDWYGLRFASNDYLTILTENEPSWFYLILNLKGVPGCQDIIFFDDLYREAYIYATNIAIGRNQAENQLYFIFLMTEIWSSDSSLKLGRVTIDPIKIGDEELPPEQLHWCFEHGLILWPEANFYDLKLEPSEISNMQLDPNGKYAYIFLIDDIIIYDIENNKAKQFKTKNIILFGLYFIHALDISETNDGTKVAITAGYGQEERSEHQSSQFTVYLMQLNPPSNLSIITNINLTETSSRDVPVSYSNFNNGMAVAIHNRTQKVLISSMYFETVYLLSFTNTNITLIGTFNYKVRSVAWLDDEGILAAFLISDLETLPWARSKVLVVNTSTNDGQIMYVYPNNQQNLSANWYTPAFMQMSTTRNRQVVLQTDDGFITLVPKSPPGYFSPMQDVNFNGTVHIQCPPGTYKNRCEAAPCEVCPTGTASSIQNEVNGNAVTICTKCSENSFCPLASVNNVNLSSYPSENIPRVYPEAQPSDSFDDVLINNAFSIDGRSGSCVVKSPLFWTFVVMAICFIMILIMGVLYYSPKTRTHFIRLRYIFRQTDLIGEGEFWVGGLITFSLLVLVIYGFWFGTAFVTLYPVETSDDANFVCDTSLRNAKFTSSLHFLGSYYGEQDIPLFKMLNEQNLTLKEVLGAFMVDVKPNECFNQQDNATLTLSFQLSSHEVILVFFLIGNAYVGGIRLCLTSSEKLNVDTINTVQQLKFCQSVFTSDQTLAKYSRINIDMTKVINQTESLVEGEPATFSGIWLPRVIPEHINDKMAYDQEGPYVRYLATEQAVHIIFTETPFFIMNIQEPIARSGEIIFKNILFSTMCLELFGFAFLLFKLVIFPLIRRCITMIRRCQFFQSESKPAQESTVEAENVRKDA